MKKFNSLLIALILTLLLNSTAFAAVTPPVITAQAGILVDYNNKQILFGKNIDAKLGPASTTKIITALITLERCKLDDKVTIGKLPPHEEGSKIYLIEGETLTARQLLYSLLLESANDCALALAEHIGGSKEGFSKIMNERAKELGCKNTNFINPNGLYDPNHYTTAYDLSLITIEALKNPEFRKLISTRSYQIPPTNKQPKLRYLNNHNKLLYSKRYKYVGADGVKTGYTVKTKHTFVGSATRGGRQLIAITLMNQKLSYDDVKVLFDYGFSSFAEQKVMSKDDLIENYNIPGTITSIPLYPQSDVYFSLPIGEKLPDKINKKVFMDTFTDIKKDMKIGYMEVSTDSGYKIYVPIVSHKDYSSSFMPSNIGTKTYTPIVTHKFIIGAIGVVATVILLTSIIIYKRKRNRL